VVIVSKVSKTSTIRLSIILDFSSKLCLQIWISSPF